MVKATTTIFTINLILQGGMLAMFQDPTQIGWGVGQFLINLVAVIVAGIALYKYIVQARHTMKKVEEALPTLFDIAKEFNPNSKDGDSLRQVIDQLTINVSTLKAQAELLLETAEPPIFMSDISGQMTFVNTAWTNVTGVPADDALGTGWTQAIHDDERIRVYAEWSQSVKDQRPFFLEFRIVNEIARKIYHVRARTSGITDINKKYKGKLVAYIGQLKILRVEEY